MLDQLKIKGKYIVEHVRGGVVIATHEVSNSVTDVGMQGLFDTMFFSATPSANWYVLLVDNTSFSAFAGSDTASSHSGWIESAAYSETTREQWTVGAAASRISTNSSPVVFSINATATLKGIALISNSTKSGTTGLLFSEAAFSSNINVANGDSLRITYSTAG